MTHPIAFGRTVVFLLHCLSSAKVKFAYLFNYLLPSLLLEVNLFWIELTYFLFLSAIGYGALKLCNNTNIAAKDNFDIFFMSVSAATVSSMSTIEMEVFSNLQLIIISLLMLAGGEVFSSLIGLQLLNLKSKKFTNTTDSDHSNPTIFLDHIVTTTNSHIEIEKQDLVDEPNPEMRCKSLHLLLYIVLWYLLVTHLAGCILVYIYTIAVSSAKQILKRKGINLITFSAFVVASTFANVGFVPTNENMVVFKKNSGLLLILIPQILMGNTLYPAFLRFIIWLLERKTKRPEFSYILRNSRELGYNNMLSGLYTKSLVVTVVGFIMLQFICFCSLEWHSEATIGLSNYEKIVGSLFQVINSRHCGESAFDLSFISPPMLLLFLVMMYLPPTTCFLPFKEKEKEKEKENPKTKFSNVYFLFSPLCYLVVSIFLICVAEREKMRDDPLNFNVFNILLEVISAYGNVGFSMGYSCEKQMMKHNGHCKDATYGFVGRWSNLGRFILITVMLGGKLKKFGINGGKAWKFL